RAVTIAVPLFVAFALQPQFFFDLFYPREEFSEAADPGDLLLGFLDRSCGITEPHATGHAFGNAALRRDHAAIGDFDVSHDSDLTRHRDAFADASAARDSSLRYDY